MMFLDTLPHLLYAVSVKVSLNLPFVCCPGLPEASLQLTLADFVLSLMPGPEGTVLFFSKHIDVCWHLLLLVWIYLNLSGHCDGANTVFDVAELS